MNQKRIVLTLIILGLSILTSSLLAQNVITTKTGSEYTKYIDSLKKEPYKWRFPILGDTIRKKGFDIPYPNGLTLQYAYTNMDITLNNLSVGFQDDPSGWIDVDSIATFNYIKPSTNAALIRYDVWILPFINIYGMVGYEETKTAIELGTPFVADFESDGKGAVLGWGVNLSAGVNSWFITGDYNQIWTFVPQLFDPAFSQQADIRLGHTFTFKKNRPWSNISVMAGGSWLKISSESQGSANLSELFGVGDNKPEYLEKLNTWYNGLPPHLQDKFEPIYDKLEGWLSDDSDSLIYYGFNKKVPKPWSMTIGANYQINHRWDINTIYTFLGSRNQFTIGLNYRFGLKGKNMFAGDIDRKLMHKIKQ